MQKFFKAGQTVYHYSYGKGVVKIIQDGLDYPVFVDFEDGLTETFTFDGRSITGMGISLSQKPIEPIVNTPINVFEIGDYVEHPELGVGVIVKTNNVCSQIEFKHKYATPMTIALRKITEEEYYEKFFQKNDVVLYKDSYEDDACWRIGYFIEYEFKNGKNCFSVSNNKTDISSCISWNQCKLHKP